MRGFLAVAGAVCITAAGLGAPHQPPSAPQTSTRDVALRAQVLTVTGYTFGGVLHWNLNDFFQGAECGADSGNTCTAVPYVSASPLFAESTGAKALGKAIDETPVPTTVLGYSQGAAVATRWIQQHAGTADAPAPEDLSFILAGNPLRKYGGIRPRLGLDDPTPDSEYSVVDIALEYDGAADMPDNLGNIVAVANAIAGFWYIHIRDYPDADLDSTDKLVWVDGNTTYVLLRTENLPLLQPLRDLGLNTLADKLNAPLKKIVDAAYDRDYPGMVDPETYDPMSGISQPAEATDDAQPSDDDTAQAPAGGDTSPTAALTSAVSAVSAEPTAEPAAVPPADSAEETADGDTTDGDGVSESGDPAPDASTDSTAVQEPAAQDDAAEESPTDGDQDSAAASEDTDQGTDPDSDPDTGAEPDDDADQGSGARATGLTRDDEAGHDTDSAGDTETAGTGAAGTRGAAAGSASDRPHRLRDLLRHRPQREAAASHRRAATSHRGAGSS